MFPINTLINHYKKSCFLSFVFAVSSIGLLQAQNEVIPLWALEIPNAIAATDYVEQKVEKGNMVEFYSKVTIPTLTVFAPEKPNGTAIVICPGGGYGNLYMIGEGYKVAKWLNTIGITAFILKYRLPSDVIMKDKTIGPLQDAQESIRYIKRNAAKWSINTEKVGVMGFSAGGHLASSLSTHYKDAVYTVTDGSSARPDFSVLIYPVISMEDQHTHKGSRTNLLGNTPSKEAIEKYTNQKHVDAATPATFIAHAMDDKSVVVQNSIEYLGALKNNNVPCEAHFYQNGKHGFGMGRDGTTSQNWSKHLEYWLSNNNFIPKTGAIK